MKIIGITYIGKKPRMTDHITGSGAVFAPGQTLNFTEDAAKRLAAHKDIFTAGEPVQGDKVFGGKGQTILRQESAAYINLQAMERPALEMFAKREFNINLEPGLTIEQARATVHTAMVNSTLDEIAANAPVAKDETRAFKTVVNVNEDELAGIQSGALKVVVVSSGGSTATGINAAQAAMIADALGLHTVPAEEMTALESSDKPLFDAFHALLAMLPTEEVVEEQEKDELPAELTSEAIELIKEIEGAKKERLLEIATELKVEVNPDAPVPTLRKVILKSLSATE